MLIFLCTLGTIATGVMTITICIMAARRERNTQMVTLEIMQTVSTLKHAIAYLENYGPGKDLEYTRARVILHNALASILSDLPSF